MTLEQKTTKRKIAMVSSVFACAILIGAVSITSAHAGVGYDAGEKLKGFTYNHKTVSESKAKQACSGDKQDECIECIQHRADLEGLKGYEVVKCLKEPTKYNY